MSDSEELPILGGSWSVDDLQQYATIVHEDLTRQFPRTETDMVLSYDILAMYVAYRLYAAYPYPELGEEGNQERLDKESDQFSEFVRVLGERNYETSWKEDYGSAKWQLRQAAEELERSATELRKKAEELI